MRTLFFSTATLCAKHPSDSDAASPSHRCVIKQIASETLLNSRSVSHSEHGTAKEGYDKKTKFLRPF